jgi:hypothetical protein
VWTPFQTIATQKTWQRRESNPGPLDLQPGSLYISNVRTWSDCSYSLWLLLLWRGSKWPWGETRGKTGWNSALYRREVVSYEDGWRSEPSNRLIGGGFYFFLSSRFTPFHFQSSFTSLLHRRDFSLYVCGLPPASPRRLQFLKWNALCYCRIWSIWRILPFWGLVSMCLLTKGKGLLSCRSSHTLGGCSRYVFLTLGGDWLLIQLPEPLYRHLAMASMELIARGTVGHVRMSCNPGIFTVTIATKWISLTSKLCGLYPASELYRLSDRHLSAKSCANFCG